MDEKWLDLSVISGQTALMKQTQPPPESNIQIPHTEEEPKKADNCLGTTPHQSHFVSFVKTLKKMPLEAGNVQVAVCKLGSWGCVNYQTANSAGQDVVEASFDDFNKSSLIGGGSYSGHELFQLTLST